MAVEVTLGTRMSRIRSVGRGEDNGSDNEDNLDDGQQGRTPPRLSVPCGNRAIQTDIHARLPFLGESRRIALIHPPWFTDDEQQLGVAYFKNQGFDVVYANQMRLRGFHRQNQRSSAQIYEVCPGELYTWARTQVPAEAEAILFSGNGFRVIGVIAALEEDLGRPVLTANQVAFWHALRQAGVHGSVNGYGRLFRS